MGAQWVGPGVGEAIRSWCSTGLPALQDSAFLRTPEGLHFFCDPRVKVQQLLVPKQCKIIILMLSTTPSHPGIGGS
jgi:hypothetical protein